MPAGRWCPYAFTLLGVMGGAACGGQPSEGTPPVVDAGESEDATFTLVRDGTPKKDGRAPEVDAGRPWARMQMHDGRVLATMHLQIVYFGNAGEDGAPDFDDFQRWLVTSNYWGILKQYGVSAGVILGSVRIPVAQAFPSGLVQKNLISSQDLDSRIIELLHPDLSSGDAGAPDAAPSLIPTADAYIFFLPNGVNVSLGNEGSHVFQTCVEAGGYHSFDGFEPYAVIPPCSFGRSPLAISHELAEMATDPFPGHGWYSDKDFDNAGGEIADLCNQEAIAGVDGWPVTQLWSNEHGECRP